MGKVENILRDLRTAVETWDENLASKAVEEAIEEGISPYVAIEAGLGKGMMTISALFDEGKIFLPQVLAASKTMQNAMERLGPQNLFHTLSKGVVVLGTVEGDIHEIGKNVVKAFLRGGGYDVIDLGKDVPAEEFVVAAKMNEAQIVGGSALMTTTLICQQQIVQAIKDEKMAEVKTIFGGAPCNLEWVRKIGGDGYCSSGAEVIDLVKRLLNE